jgi:hypothetical protein
MRPGRETLAGQDDRLAAIKPWSVGSDAHLSRIVSRGSGQREMPKVASHLLFFAPEHWGELDRFSHLCSGTYTFSGREQRALAGVGQHFEKAVTFRRIAEWILPNLEIDRDQLNTQGFTPAEHSRMLAAVVEASIVELYSCVDCTAKVLRAIYGKRSRGFKDSTRSLFENVDAITGDFPNALKDAIRGVDWFKRLLFLRDELTHLGAGSCHLPEGTESVSYHHRGIKEEDKPLIIDSVFAWLDGQFEAINLFIGRVFNFLRGTLSNKPVHQMCGMVEGRMLMRVVDPTQPLNSSSGTCLSWIWFEKPDMPTCPFAATCGAYTRIRSRPPEEPSVDVGEAPLGAQA